MLNGNSSHTTFCVITSLSQSARGVGKLLELALYGKREIYICRTVGEDCVANLKEKKKSYSVTAKLGVLGEIKSQRGILVVTKHSKPCADVDPQSKTLCELCISVMK